MDAKTLPVILAGPIIRRAEPSKVFIWIATSKSYRLHAKLFKITTQEGNSSFQYQNLYTDCECHSIRMGKQLYINLLQITPLKNETFPTDILIGYNLQFRNISGLQDLKSLGLLNKDDPHSLTYGHLDYPAFQIKSSGPTTILYGSCRKPHGKGEDILVEADLLLKKRVY